MVGVKHILLTVCRGLGCYKLCKLLSATPTVPTPIMTDHGSAGIFCAPDSAIFLNADPGPDAPDPALQNCGVNFTLNLKLPATCEEFAVIDPHNNIHAFFLFIFYFSLLDPDPYRALRTSRVYIL